jgi:excisionase family DNA binding protein
MTDVTPVSALPEAPTLGSALEASNALRISRTQVYRLMDEGVLESVRVGTRRLILWDSVLRLLEPQGTAS